MTPPDYVVRLHARSHQRGLLEQIKTSNDDGLRTSKVEGKFPDLPAVDSQFFLFAEALTPGNDFRMVSTGIIKSVTEVSPGKFEFETMNSTYRLTTAPLN